MGELTPIIPEIQIQGLPSNDASTRLSLEANGKDAGLSPGSASGTARDTKPKQLAQADKLNLPDVQITPDKPLTEDEKQRVSFLQEQLLNTYPLAATRAEKVSDEQHNANVKRDLDALTREKNEGRFGPATQKAFSETVNWIEKLAVPGAINELSRLALPIPAGSPLELPVDAQGRPVSLDYYKSLVSANRIKADLRIDTKTAPSDTTLDTVQDTMTWLRTVDSTVREAREQRQNQLLEEQIKKLIPNPEQQKAWLDKRGGSNEEWRAAAIDTIDLTTRIKNYVEAMDSLNRAGHRFPIELPPGCQVERNKDGRITHVSLDLPKDLRLGHPENAKKMENLRSWLHTNGDQIDQAVKELIKLEQNPDRLLFWGEIDMPHGRAKVDAQGNITEFVDPKKADGSEKEFNLAQMRFDVTQRTGTDGKPKIVVSNNLQYEKANWYNYLNVGAEDVGKRIDVAEREYDPEDWVPIRNGGKVEIVKAKDLESWKTNQQVFHYGEKALVATLDAAMLVTGTIEVGAALKAARAGELIASQAMKQALKGGIRAAVGGAGIVNSAYFNETGYGKSIQVARGLYFVGDAALSLGQGGWGLVKNMRGAQSSAQSAGAVVEAQIKASNWAKTYTYGERAAKLTELPFAYMIYRDINHQIGELGNIGRANPVTSAIRQAAGGRGDQKPEGSANTATGGSLDLNRYRSLFNSDNRQGGDEAAKVAQNILEKAQQLSRPDASKEERAKFTQQLMDNFKPDANRIVTMEKDGTFASDRSQGYIKHSESQNRTVQTAAALALLQLAEKTDAKLPDTLQRRDITVPEYEKTQSVVNAHTGTPHTVTTRVPSRTESQELKTSDIVSFLRRELETPRSDSQPVVASDLALQVGAATGIEVAGVLQDVVTNNSSSTYEKSQAVMRLGAIVDALKVQEALPVPPEQKFKDDSKRVGLSSSAIEQFLKSATDASTRVAPEVRSAAALMLHANTESGEARTALLREYALKLSEFNGHPEKLTAYASERLNNAMNSGSQKQKFEAASILMHLSPDSASKQKALETVANSVSPQDMQLTNRAMQILVPGRIIDLDEKNPDVANKVRLTAIEILRNTQVQLRNATLTADGEAQRVEFFKSLEPLMKGGQALPKSQVDSLLRDMIDPASGNFADISPALRRASVQALSDLGSRSSIPVLRERVMGSKEKGIEADKDAGVRERSLEALDRMKDPELRSLVLTTMDRERDPKVADRLTAVQFSQQRPELNSEEYKKAYERTAAALMKDPFEGWSTLKTEIEQFKAYLPKDQKSQAAQMFVRNWRSSSFWMLDGVEYNRFRDAEGERAAKSVYSGVGGFLDWVFSSSGTVTSNENTARNEKRAEIETKRNGQFQELVQFADRNTADGIKAKMALVDILINGGQPFASAESDWAQQKSAEALRNLTAPGVENREYVAWAIQLALTSGPAMNKQAREHLLEGIKSLATPDSRGRIAISREAAATTIAQALDLENNLRSPYQADPNLQMKYIDALAQFKHHKVFPVLEAIANERKGTALGIKAEVVMADLRDSVNLMWDETVPDRVSTAAMQAQSIEKALTDGTKTEATIETIFAATKDSRLIGLDDPRLPLLKVALNDSNERVRLAAARALVSIAGNNNVDMTGARRTLEQVSQSGSRPAYRRDAQATLKLIAK
jgi:HEAT repeat.